MEIKIENISKCNIVYITRIGAYGSENIPIMEKLKRWAKNNKLINDKPVIIAIIHNNPQETAPENCRYDACIVVDKKFIEDESVKNGEIAEGKYAIFTVEHTVQEMSKVWQNMFSMLLKKGFIPDCTRPIMERYSQEKVDNHLCEICVPIK